MFEVIEVEVLNPDEERKIILMLEKAFEGDFATEDWEHTFGGSRFLGFLNSELIAHGAVVPREIRVDGEVLKVGYIEGIAVDPKHWGKGFGSNLMAAISLHCRSEFIFSMLSTDQKAFYRSHGWEDFLGQSYVLEEGIEVRTADEDSGLMYLPGLKTGTVSPKKVVCESRSGDVW